MRYNILKPNSVLCREERGEQVLYHVDLRSVSGQNVAVLSIRGAGHTHTGLNSLVLLEDGVEHTYRDGAWDNREWQWWKGHPFGDAMRPRLFPATCGGEVTYPFIRVWSTYNCDGIATYQEWFLTDQRGTNSCFYDCLQTVRNISGEDLKEYFQFFACYTQINDGLGCFFWSDKDKLVNFRDIGGQHLDRYVTGRDKIFSNLGVIPGCPRGEGKLAAIWKRPVLVSQPTSNGWRHVILCETSHTAAITMGMKGIAMDYIIYPSEESFKLGESFSSHIRHHIIKLPVDRETDTLQKLWKDFEKSNKHVHSLSKAFIK